MADYVQIAYDYATANGLTSEQVANATPAQWIAALGIEPPVPDRVRQMSHILRRRVIQMLRRDEDAAIGEIRRARLQAVIQAALATEGFDGVAVEYVGEDETPVTGPAFVVRRAE